MKTKTLFYPSSKKPELEVEITQAGDIVNAYALVPYFDYWICAMELLKNRPKLMEEIRQDSACLDWRDDGDFKYENHKDFLAEVRRGESA